MGFFDAFKGRKAPAQPDLNNIFGVPSAAITLETSMGFTPTGSGAVAFRSAEGKAFEDLEAEIRALLSAGGVEGLSVTKDEFGYTWIEVATSPPDAAALVTALHAVNLSLQDAGFGPQLLCSLVPFSKGDRRLALVYLFKRGTFYPFAPERGGQRRDNMVELQVKELLKSDIALEQDLTKWFPVWGAPGL